jgi:hypothetical protein
MDETRSLPVGVFNYEAFVRHPATAKAKSARLGFPAIAGSVWHGNGELAMDFGKMIIDLPSPNALTAVVTGHDADLIAERV